MEDFDCLDPDKQRAGDKQNCRSETDFLRAETRSFFRGEEVDRGGCNDGDDRRGDKDRQIALRESEDIAVDMNRIQIRRKEKLNSRNDDENEKRECRPDVQKEREVIWRSLLGGQMGENREEETVGQEHVDNIKEENAGIEEDVGRDGDVFVCDVGGPGDS